MTLTEFLLARIAEDEAIARDVVRPEDWSVHDASTWRDLRNPELVGGGKGLAVFDAEYGSGAADHVARHNPVRVLAECEAKGLIVERAGSLLRQHAASPLAKGVLRALALPYANHPDYDPSWRLAN